MKIPSFSNGHRGNLSFLDGKSIFDEVKVNLSLYLKFTEACTEWSTRTGMGYDAPEPKEEQNKKWKFSTLNQGLIGRKYC